MMEYILKSIVDLNDGIYSEKYSCKYLQGCCRQRDHKDRLGSRLPIPSQRLRSGGDFLSFETERHSLYMSLTFPFNNQQ